MGWLIERPKIESGRATLYDEDVVDVALRLFRKQGYKIPD